MTASSMLQRTSGTSFLNAFTETWGAAYQADKTSIDQRYASPNGWTEFMLERQTGLIERVMERLNRDRADPLKMARQWYTVDAIFYSGKNIYGSEGYPSEVHALIEHENRDDVETEMWKLLHWRAPLKVLIFYDWNDADKKGGHGDRPKWLDEKLVKLREMHRDVNAFQGSDTEYLFLVGNRSASRDIGWRNFGVGT